MASDNKEHALRMEVIAEKYGVMEGWKELSGSIIFRVGDGEYGKF